MTFEKEPRGRLARERAEPEKQEIDGIAAGDPRVAGNWRGRRMSDEELERCCISTG